MIGAKEHKWVVLLDLQPRRGGLVFARTFLVLRRGGAFKQRVGALGAWLLFWPHVTKCLRVTAWWFANATSAVVQADEELPSSIPPPHEKQPLSAVTAMNPLGPLGARCRMPADASNAARVDSGIVIDTIS